MDKVIRMGIDGWKTDGTDPYIFELGIAWGYKVSPPSTYIHIYTIYFLLFHFSFREIETDGVC